MSKMTAKLLQELASELGRRGGEARAAKYDGAMLRKCTKKGDRRGVMEEYHAAYTLYPKNATYKQYYERLLPTANK